MVIKGLYSRVCFLFCIAYGNPLLCYLLNTCTYLFGQTTGMPHFRIMKARQSSIHKFESLKRKLCNCNASIYFNKQCFRRNPTPAYAKICTNLFINTTGMAHCRFMNANQSSIHKFESLKRKLFNCNENIYLTGSALDGI